MPFHDESLVMPDPGETYNIRPAAAAGGDEPPDAAQLLREGTATHCQTGINNPDSVGSVPEVPLRDTRVDWVWLETRSGLRRRETASRERSAVAFAAAVIAVGIETVGVAVCMVDQNELADVAAVQIW